MVERKEVRSKRNIQKNTHVLEDEGGLNVLFMPLIVFIWYSWNI